ncbi:MAG: hypothetical protein HFG14_03200 [Lachnospiraceae bacterium]|nr:hypothetical protein [Lachnospiraceae bacterium]
MIPTTIYCPVCRRRLFDTDPAASGQIRIKCPRCRQIQQISLRRSVRTPDTGSSQSHIATT